jgi:carboxyl-terminal processing protease
VSNTKNSKIYVALPLLLALTLAIGILTGATMADSSASGGNIINSILKFKEILTYVERDYVDEVDAEELVETAITKMLEKLDPHSVYIPAKDLDIAKSQLEGEFDGIGVEFNIIKDTIYIVAPLNGGPSEKAGLMAGDKIVSVDGENVAGIGISNREVFNKLRGPKGSKVALGIKRRAEKKVLSFDIVRDKIPQHSVDASYMVDKEIGYIKVSRFSATTYEEFRTALKSLIDQGMTKLVLDLQGNPGGYMDRAINMVDEMLAVNKMIVYTDGKDARYDTEAKSQRKGMFESGAVIVLIDEGSASASEIVSGALQDHDRALIVGRRSFGKGLVQMPISLSDGSELRLTISRYYTPSGRSIQKPYTNGGDSKYGNDIVERYEHGEMFHQDSIKFIDSLKYTTAKGRTVYGGGGIMPDYFVPFDTTINSEYLTKLYNHNIVREYALKYYDKNKDRIKKMSFEDYLENFEVTDAMLQEMVRLAEKSEIKYNEKQFRKSKDVLKIHVKALIAKSMWNSKGFYPIFNQTNEVFKEALKLFDEAEKLARSN